MGSAKSGRRPADVEVWVDRATGQRYEVRPFRGNRSTIYGTRPPIYTIGRAPIASRRRVRPVGTKTWSTWSLGYIEKTLRPERTQ